jgi:hypothetical protein
MSSTITALLLLAGLVQGQPPQETLASLRLYNPTDWTGPSLVQIPVGRLAAPGIIDWSNSQLILGSRELPFAIREGRAHWKAQLQAPVDRPRAEDLLVFWSTVPPGEWADVQVVNGSPDKTPVLLRKDGALSVRYPGIEAVVDERTGMLLKLSLAGEAVLEGAFEARAWSLPGDPFVYTGNIGPGYVPFQVAVTPSETRPMAVRLVSSSSTPAVTELNFELSASADTDMALTYRFHRGGLVEIQADERPWIGESPWMDGAVSYTLPLRGKKESLPRLENRQPFYGFKDFAGTIRQVAERYRGADIDLVVVGEETPNGRRWTRRLQALRHGGDRTVADLVESMDEGLIVQPVAVGVIREALPQRILRTEKTAPMADVLVAALQEVGIPVEMTEEDPDEGVIRFDLIPAEIATKITGDGFEIRQNSSGTVRVTAKTPLGLYQAATEMAAGLRYNGRLPLIARNPVVDMRGGGFGGGTFEVDFPYGTDAEWEHVFTNLLDSGMNTFWCLGMWGNWKMPVSYAAMPELRSDDPKAYDESSGILFSELEAHRAHGLKLMRFLQDRGGRVYVWLPIGCVPTTFMDHYPEAIAPGKVGEFWGRPKGTPCFTHPTYRKYLDAFLQELIDTYPLDGVVLVRDDNGGICDCERCTKFTANSVTKNAVWEQYLQIHAWLRDHDFKGAIGVYPYFDGYTPALDAQMPDDLFIAGHGASTAALTRNQEQIGHMPDTWLDSLFTNFKLPSSPRMRRLLADRGSFWIGGAYKGTELPWEALGYFGWEPTATPNTFRFQWGMREFGSENALAFVRMNDACEALWEINARFMIPNEWIALSEGAQARVGDEARNLLREFTGALDGLRKSAPDYEDAWFDHTALFAVFFEYHLRRLELFVEMTDIAREHGAEIDGGEGLPRVPRSALLEKHTKMKAWATLYSEALHKIPGDMLKATRNMTMPYDEWMSGFEGWLDPHLPRKQFAATLNAEVPEIRAGEPFSIVVNVHNTGIISWDECHLGLSDNAKTLSLTAEPHPAGQVVAPGDTATRTLTGIAPGAPGEIQLTLTAFSPTRNRMKIGEAMTTLSWE